MTLNKKRIAILGAGPSGLFIFKRLADAGNTDFEIEIFEKNEQLGAGMPYSKDGATAEHITNVSGNEIPELETSLSEWIQTVPAATLKQFNINAEKFSDYKVLPRLLFGEYLSAQFHFIEQRAKDKGIIVTIHRGTTVTDIIDDAAQKKVKVVTDKEQPALFNYAIICTGHHWPVVKESVVKGYFDSPYPPSKLALKLNHAVAIRGSSLTAIDAVRTLARHNGDFIKNDGRVSYKLADDSAGFKMIMHTRNGLLPAVRFHLEDSHLGKDSLLTREDIQNNRDKNEGFLSLDFVFEKNFKAPIKDKEPEFYEKIKNMKLEDFVEFVMSLRETVEPFNLLKGEYAEAEKSIRRKDSVYWKEMLAVLSFTMNYPAKYFSAEDTLRLHKILLPLISIVIAFVPQTSAEEMMALHDEGLLQLISVGEESKVVANETLGGAVYHYADENKEQQSPHFETYIDATGQPHLTYMDLPYKSLLANKTVSPAKIKFRDANLAIREKENGNKNIVADAAGNYYLNVSGIAINDNFQVIDEYGAYNERIFMMAVPYIGGYNPDYSGLDFCEAASKMIVDTIMKEQGAV